MNIYTAEIYILANSQLPAKQFLAGWYIVSEMANLMYEITLSLIRIILL